MVGETGGPLLCPPGIPLADARLLAIDDDKSRAVARVPPASLGGCCNGSGPLTFLAVLAVSASGVSDAFFGELNPWELSAVYSLSGGCECSWRNRRICPSCLWCCSNRWRVRRAWRGASAQFNMKTVLSFPPLDQLYSLLRVQIQLLLGRVPHWQPLDSNALFREPRSGHERVPKETFRSHCRIS